MYQNLGIDTEHLRSIGVALRIQVCKIPVNLEHGIPVEVRMIIGFREYRRHGLHGRLAAGARHRRDGAIDGARAGPHAFDVAGNRHARAGMAMQLNGYVELLDKGAHQPLGHDRRKDACHIFNANGIDPELLLLARILHEFLDGVHRTDGVTKRTLRMTAVLLDGAHRRLDVSRIVECIEHPEYVHAVLTGQRHETVDHVVGVITVPHQVLSAQKHLQRRLFGLGLDKPQSLPRILPKKAKAHVERGPAPAFEGIISDAVDNVDDFFDVHGAHARRPQGLMRVPQGGIRNAKRYPVEFVLDGLFFRGGHGVFPLVCVGPGGCVPVLLPVK